MAHCVQSYEDVENPMAGFGVWMNGLSSTAQLDAELADGITYVEYDLKGPVPLLLVQLTATSID